MNVPLVSLILMRSLVFPILLFSSISLHWSLREAFLSLLAILWNSAFRLIYLSFSPLPLASFLFSAVCKASSGNYFAFSHFFFLGIILVTAFCMMLRTSIHSSSGTLSIRSSSWYLFVSSNTVLYFNWISFMQVVNSFLFFFSRAKYHWHIVHNKNICGKMNTLKNK